MLNNFCSTPDPASRILLPPVDHWSGGADGSPWWKMTNWRKDWKITWIRSISLSSSFGLAITWLERKMNIKLVVHNISVHCNAKKYKYKEIRVPLGSCLPPSSPFAPQASHYQGRSCRWRLTSLPQLALVWSPHCGEQGGDENEEQPMWIISGELNWTLNSGVWSLDGIWQTSSSIHHQRCSFTDV